MADAHLSLGSNQGDRAALIEAAIAQLAATPGIRVTARSRLYRTPPWGEVVQGEFLNAACTVETSLGPHDLLDACLAIERSLGRVRRRRWGPREIDIDILRYGEPRSGDLRLADPKLTLPHPYWRDRAFVLVPLAEIAPDLVIDGSRIADALAAIDVGGIRQAGP